MKINPARTITVAFNGKNMKATARCGVTTAKIVCAQSSLVKPTDSIDGNIIDVDNITAFDSAACLILSLDCACENVVHQTN